MSSHASIKRIIAWLLIAVSLMVAVGLIAYVTRHKLLETLIQLYLHKQGVPVQSLVLRDVSSNAVLLQDLVLGMEQELRIDQIQVRWNLRDLYSARSTIIEIIGLQLKLDVSGKHPLWGSLQPILESSGKSKRGGEDSLSWLPALALKDAKIHLHSEFGDFVIGLSADFGQDAVNTHTLKLSTQVSSSLGQIEGTLVATRDAQGEIQGKLVIDDSMLNLPEVKLAQFTAEATFSLATAIAQKNDAASKMWAGRLDLQMNSGSLITGPLHFQRTSIALPLHFNLEQDIWRISLNETAQITLNKIASIDTLSFPRPLELIVSQADFEWINTPQNKMLNHRIVIDPANFVMLSKAKASPAVKIQVHSKQITFNGSFDGYEKYQGQLAISDLALALPQIRLRLKKIATHFTFDPEQTGIMADFTIGSLQHQAPTPFFKALTFSGRIKQQLIEGKPASYALSATGGIRNSRFLRFTGKHTPDSGEGMFKVMIAGLKFSEDHLQPDALSPLLTSFKNVSGLVNAYVQIHWSHQGIGSNRASVKLQDISLSHEVVRIDDLNASLQLSNLLKFSSLPKQIITIRHLDPGIPIEDVLISYQIKKTDPPSIDLEKAYFSVMDGLLAVEPVLINPDSASTAITVRVNHIDLATFFELIQVDGLTGTGHLDGSIPLILENDQIVVSNSHLAANAPGILRFKSNKASQFLADAGEEINLLLQAVQDFHYTELTLDLDKSATHELIVRLSLLGNNPNVKDGQTFRLNIRLESNIDKILKTINQGYSFSNEILRGAFSLH